MLVNFDPTWADPTSSWWAKVNRAGEHVESLRAQVAAFRASRPYFLTAEPTDAPDRLAGPEQPQARSLEGHLGRRRMGVKETGGRR